MSDQKKFIDPHQALLKAQKYCAYQERSQQEVRDKLYSLGLHKRDVEATLAELITSGFLKEERFAIAFAGGKFRIKKWGRTKIEAALKQKKVSSPVIRMALKAIDERDYSKALSNLIEQRSKKISEPNPFKRKNKLAQYAISRGFESELVWQLLS